MRYLPWPVVIVLVFIGVLLLTSAMKRRRRAPDGDEDQPAASNDTGVFIAILLIGAGVLIALAIIFEDYLLG